MCLDFNILQVAGIYRRRGHYVGQSLCFIFAGVNQHNTTHG